MKNVKTLIFDFGGVIINLTRNRCIESFEKLGMENIRESLANNYQHREMFMQVELGNITSEQFRDEIRIASGRNLTDEQINTAWISMLDDIASYKLDLLLKLKKNYKVLLLSNTNEIHWNWALKNSFDYKGKDVNDFFDTIYLSYKLHMLKPDVEIFQYVLQNENLNPEETFFIDDALTNCKSAESLGLRTYTPQPREDWSFLFE